MEGLRNIDESFDFGSFIHYPEDNSESVDFQLPAMDTSAEALQFSDMQLFPETDSSQFDFNLFEPLDCSTYDLSNENSFTAEVQPQAEDFRCLVDSWASADPRLRSSKQKRRDAAIDLHLQRFMNSHSEPQLFPIESDLSPSDTPSITYSQGSSSQQSPGDSTPVSSTPNSEQSSTSAPPGGRELIFDLNLNTATKLPKKQKKRTKAQIEDYINARRNGACVKHKKQHKKCNCHEKLSAKTAVNARVRKSRAALSDKSVRTPDPILNTTPSSLSISSFHQSPLSQVDNAPFSGEIDSTLAGLDDLHNVNVFTEIPVQLPMGNSFQDKYVQKEPSGFALQLVHRNFPESSSTLQPGVRQSSTQNQTLLPAGPVNTASTSEESAMLRTSQGTVSSNQHISGTSLGELSNLPGPHPPDLLLASSNYSSSASVPPATESGPEVSPVSSASVSSSLQGIEVRSILQASATSLSPTPNMSLRSASELAIADLAKLHPKDSLQATGLVAIQQTYGDVAAAAAAADWLSLMSNMVSQAIHVILALRPQLFQFLSEQAQQHSSMDLPAVELYSAALTTNTMPLALTV